MERTPGKSHHHPREEKILVTVRVRPLNSREIAHNDTSSWVCTDDRTIVFQQGGGSGPPDRSPQAKSYTFDHVFGPESATDQVYEEGAKDVALSALTGLNATIFAYGQTSSGKTYTMKGIMEKAIIDIYEHIRQHCDRDFALKVSAMEIYNEVVKDLLRSDSGPLRLLDDPEKGTIVEKLAEDIVRDSNHLKQALATCEAQRQVGETCLNDTSSRSHLIIRLTVESAPRGAKEGCLVNTLVASLNFVDLAGSERVSQTMAEGTRLKEGCHINRSLLTLTTVIRKLSSGGGKGKNGHLPYRDSKLTRILQNSLGGNARTAIICTMSPASSHVEQSRNTLFFATRAKEVTNAAHVNVVVSDKAMVKQLQKEVARLEAELRGPTNGAPPHCPSDVEALLSEKEAEIAKLKQQVEELQQERDLLQSRLNEFLKKVEEDEEESNRQISPVKTETPPLLSGFPSMDGKKPERLRVLIDRETQEEEQEIMRGSTPKPRSPSTRLRESINRQSAVRQSTPVSHLLLQEIRKLERQQDELGVNAARAWGTLQKEVECLRLAQAGMNMEAASTLSKVQQEIENMHQKPIVSDRDGGGEGNNEEDSVTVTRNQRGSLREEIRRLQASGGDGKSDADATIATLEAQLEHIQKSLDNLVLRPCAHPESTTVLRRSSSANPLASLENNSNNYQFCPEMANNTSSLCSPRTPQRTFAFDKDENEPPPYTPSSLSNGNGFHPSAKIQKNQTDMAIGGMGGDTTPNECTPPSHRRNNSVDIKKMQNMFKTAAEENIRSIRAYVTELKEKVAKLQYQKQLLVCQVLELESNRNDVEEEEDDDENLMEEGESTIILQSPSNWQALFQEQRKEIIELWDVCFVSIVHRSQFYLLFKGDRNDAIYMEVELRRLKWLQEHLAENLEEGQSTTNLASSIRALKREREFLARQMRTRVTPEEREEIFQRWKIPLDVKQRKMQLAQRLWTDPHDPKHIQDSAEVVARLVGFWEPSTGGVSKEMFELSFATGISPSPCSTNKPQLQLQPWLSGLNSGLNSIASRFLNL